LDHYSDYPSFAEALVGFSQEARRHGLNSGIQCTKETVASALEGLWLDKDQFGFALSALFCHSEEEKDIFTKIYNRYWRQRGTRINDKRDYKNKRTVKKQAVNSAVMLGVGNTGHSEETVESKTTTGSNSKETLKQTDFSKLNVIQEKELEKLSEKLVAEMSLRIKRRRKKMSHGQVDLGQSIRKNLQRGGSMIDLVRTKHKKDKYRLLILLDVSGSMDKYSFYLLKFLWTLKHHFKQIEAFTFSTSLLRITDLLQSKHLTTSLSHVSQTAKHWSSGTKIGECLKEFNDHYAKRYLNGNTLTLILSDGLDTGEPEVLDEAIHKIRLRSKKLVWLNPLKGMQGYQPIQMGMKTALPSLHHFGSAHNFDSLLELENILIDA
jgi:uncharacterized protein with von Willebrand factor type A (vWA) domain